MRKLLLGLCISFAAIIWIVYHVDISAFSKIKEQIQPWYLLAFALSGLVSTSVFGYRWHQLAQKKIKVSDAIAASFIGYGANLILPARGGDLYRVYYSKTVSGLAIPTLLSHLFIEKVIDFIFVIILGLVSFFILNKTGGAVVNHRLYYLSLLILLGLLAGLLVIKFLIYWIDNFAISFFAVFGKRDWYLQKLQKHVFELHQFLQFSKMAPASLVTLFMWLLGYASCYVSLQYFLGISLGLTQTVFIMFCGAMSMALPAAPSSAGTFHAAIMAGFVLIGRSQSEGLVYATVVHLANYILFGSAGLLFYWRHLWQMRSATGMGHKKTAASTMEGRF